MGLKKNLSKKENNVGCVGAMSGTSPSRSDCFHQRKREVSKKQENSPDSSSVNNEVSVGDLCTKPREGGGGGGNARWEAIRGRRKQSPLINTKWPADRRDTTVGDGVEICEVGGSPTRPPWSSSNEDKVLCIPSLILGRALPSGPTPQLLRKT